MKNLSKKQQKNVMRILFATILLILGHWLPISGLLLLGYYLIPYAIIGWDVLYRAIRNIGAGQVFDENFLMALATIGAFFTGEFDEAVFVMLFYQTGELFQSYALGKSRKSIAALMDIRPDVAFLETEDGTLLKTDPEDIEVGSIIIVKPGEKIPLDGIVLEGKSSLDTATLTGESVPRDVQPGDAIISGCVNQTGLLRIQVTKSCEESTVSKILDLVENSSEKKAVSEQFITRFAKYYTPCVVIAALFLAFLPPFFVGNWANWIHRALIFLVISCPCALVISVPLSFFGGIGAASRCGILIKGSNYLETLAQTNLFVFDKTGTLTEGVFSVTEVHCEPPFTKQEILKYAATAEQYSDHPIALSIRKAWGQSVDCSPDSVEELAGYGIHLTANGHQLAVGNQRLMEKDGFSVLKNEEDKGTVVYVAVDGSYAGSLVLSDLLKKDTKEAMKALKHAGARQLIMLSGDRKNVAEHIAAEAGMDAYHAELLPADKVDHFETLMKEHQSQKIAFVGDGINDAPVLARADVGIAMGALGSDAAIEAADIVLMDDNLSKIPTAMKIARKTLTIVRENIVFALGVKALVLVLGAFGHASMWAAVFADVGVAFIAILNAMRCLSVKKSVKK